MSTGILLINLGSPDSTDPKDVKTYLDEFLMDEYVIDLPYPLRYLLVKGIILNVRPKKSAHAYETIWWDDGSPLIVISERVQKKLKDIAKHPISLAMRYANPSIKAGIDDLLAKDASIDRIITVPLYPHYAMATTQTVVEKTKAVQQQFFPNVTLDFVDPFYKDQRYIDALAGSIQDHLTDKHDYLLFSYHGVPVRHLKKTDPTIIDKVAVHPCFPMKRIYAPRKSATDKYVPIYLTEKIMAVRRAKDSNTKLRLSGSM